MRATNNPIFGFGLLGWVSAAVLTALIVLVACGYDLLWEFLILLARIFGPEGPTTYMSRIHWGYSITLWSVGFGTIDVLPLVVALFLSPLPGRAWRYVLAILWTLVRSNPYAIRITGQIANAVAAGGSQATDTQYALTDVVCMTVASTAMLWAVTRSWRVAAWSAGLTAALFLGESVLAPSGIGRFQPSFTTSSILWHIGFAAIVLAWAIRLRRSALVASACPACGYDLRGRETSACPECGAAAQ